MYRERDTYIYIYAYVAQRRDIEVRASWQALLKRISM